jgi:hypothetical protein
MPKLTPEERQDRLRFDYQVVMQMHQKQAQKPNPIMEVSAFRNPDDMEKRRNPILSEDQGHLATHYLIDYHIRTLIGPGEYSDWTAVRFDLQANGNYPFSTPGIFVVEKETPHPWTPHFRSGLPVCIDHDAWSEGQGTILLGQLLVHVAKLLNFDEIPRTATYGGYTPEAAEYWRTNLGGLPITPNLEYPVLPEDIINGIVKPPKGFFEAVSATRRPREMSAEAALLFFPAAHGPKPAERTENRVGTTLQETASECATARIDNPLFSPKAAQRNVPPAAAPSPESNADANPLFKPRARI